MKKRNETERDAESQTSPPETDPYDEQPPFVAIERDHVSQLAFEESCKNRAPNYGILALEIGRWRARKNYPENPPNWALERCRELYERSQTSTRPLFSPSLGPAGYEADGQLLERVADLLSEPGKKGSLRSAIKQALEETGVGSDIDSDLRRLTRLWKNDKDYRLERAWVRYIEKRTGRRTIFDDVGRGPPEEEGSNQIQRNSVDPRPKKK